MGLDILHQVKHKSSEILFHSLITSHISVPFCIYMGVYAVGCASSFSFIGEWWFWLFGQTMPFYLICAIILYLYVGCILLIMIVHSWPCPILWRPNCQNQFLYQVFQEMKLFEIVFWNPYTARLWKLIMIRDLSELSLLYLYYRVSRFISLLLEIELRVNNFQQFL